MDLRRPYIRKEVRKVVEERAEKNEKGQFLDANTHKPIEGQYHLGHKAGHEHWREVKRAEQEGLTQKEFNDRMNNPDYYQIEDPYENQSHAHEMPADETQNYLGDLDIQSKASVDEYLGDLDMQSKSSTEEYLGDVDTQSKASAEEYLGDVHETEQQGQKSSLESDELSY